MKKITTLLLVLLCCLGLSAQNDTVISLVTCYPGPEVYQLEGHTALRITLKGHNGQPDADLAANYGLFDFAAPNFLYRFVKGETDYCVGAEPWDLFLANYNARGRRVEEQVLNLTQPEKHRLIELLKVNLLPENRVYRYNYVKDNCATRPLAIIEAALDDSVSLSLTEFDAQSLPYTFRDVMRHYHRNYPWYQFGIDLALGSGIDYVLDPSELAFAPVLLEQQLDGARVGNRLLAQPPVPLNGFDAYAAVEGPTPWYLTPLAVCTLVFVLLVIATVRDQRRRRVTRWVDALYFGIEGIAGLLLTFLIFV